ncbi:MAG: hypothetical protein BSOLF_0547 [Candidatus Carbobacillus altaicus]|uniref:Uncharacterized protein n=1 Tax=Candidatus Carbonibacillus altaicus TaxID=2163959 RepID=A0A2R6Y0M7_9BACL|nr:MAG: hypothetical protein BSOLF_0547 [Candidatus Carbobacillus altaicus]
MYNQKLLETYIITAEAGDDLIIGVKNFYIKVKVNRMSLKIIGYIEPNDDRVLI